MKITATIITFNEADNIRAACESVSGPTRLDSGFRSTDATREIAHACGARHQQGGPGFALQNSSGDAATHDWIFVLMRTSVSSDELRRRIEDLLYTRTKRGSRTAIESRAALSTWDAGLRAAAGIPTTSCASTEDRAGAGKALTYTSPSR